LSKTGFVYVWYDRKHKRYYVGCHWGAEDDGYICSSSNMKAAYKRRPKDFKRKVLARGLEDKKKLLEEEHKWLSLIKPSELGIRYYNLHNHHFNHWSSIAYKSKTTKEKMKDAWDHRKSSDDYVPPRLGKKVPLRPEAKSKLTGQERTEKQIAASLSHSQKMKGVKRGNYNVEHGKKISKARKGKSTGFVPKSAFKHGCVPWNKGRKKGENHAKTKGY
jgi:hypothetical protein